MTTFKLEAGGAQAAGQGIGNAFKALAMGRQVRDEAMQDAMFKQARMAQAGAQARKSNADAQLAENQLSFASNPLETSLLELGLPTSLAPAFKDRLATGQWSGQYAAPGDGVGPTMPAPADDDTVARLGQNLALMHRMIGSGSKVHEHSKAALDMQTGRIRDQALANVGDLDMMNRLNTLAKEGATYMPFDAIGNTGYSVNKATGQGEGLDVLQRLFGQSERARANKDNASAANSAAQAGLTNDKRNVLSKTGALPGTGSKSSEFNAGQIRDDIRADYNAIYPRGVSGYRPKDAPTYEDFSRQWLRQHNVPESVLFGGPEDRHSPKPAGQMAAPPKLKSAPQGQSDRVVGEVYSARTGAVMWTGKGWQPVLWSGSEWQKVQDDGAAPLGGR